MSISIRHLRGVKTLAQDAIGATLDVSEALQQKLTRTPYAALQRMDGIAAPARRIETVHAAISRGVYAALRLANRGASSLAGVVLDLAERRTGSRSGD